jgi:hypothetical protein
MILEWLSLLSDNIKHGIWGKKLLGLAVQDSHTARHSLLAVEALKVENTCDRKVLTKYFNTTIFVLEEKIASACIVTK